MPLAERLDEMPLTKRARYREPEDLNKLEFPPVIKRLKPTYEPVFQPLKEL